MYDLSVVRARSLVRSATFFFAFVAGVTAFKSASSALFLARRDPTDLPYLYLATALIITLATIYLGNRLTYQRAKPVLRTSLLVATIVLGLLSVLAAIDFRPALGAVYVAGEVYATAISVLFWARLGEVFDVRSAKRVFGTIGAAGMGGAILGGLAVRLGVGQVPAAAWCFFATFTLIAIRPLLGKTAESGAIHRRKLAFKEGLTYAAVDRFPRGVMLLVLFLAIQTAAVDYVFRTGSVSFEQGSVSGLAGLFGVLNAIVGVFALLFQVLLTRRLLGRIGVFAFLSIIPSLSIVAAVFALTFPALFLPLFLLKALEMMGSLSLNQPALQLLYNPMPTEMRDSVRAVIDGAVKKLGGAVGGVVLIVIGAKFTQSHLLLLVLFIGAGLLLWIQSLRQGYRRALVDKLGHSESGALPAIDPSDGSTRRAMLRALAEDDPGKVLAAIDVLTRTGDNSGLQPHLARLISHPAEPVRLKAIELITQAPDPAFAPLLVEVIQKDARRPKAQAARALDVVDHQIALRTMAPIVDAEPGVYDLGLVCAAIEVLLKDPAHQTAAKKALENFLNSSHRGPSSQRRELARLIGHLGPSSPYAMRLKFYLDDPESSVRTIAAQSAAMVRAPDLREKLVSCLEDRSLRTEAQKALAAYGEDIIPFLSERLNARRLPVSLRVHIPKVMRFIGTEEAISAMLFSNVHDDAFLRYVIVRALDRLRRQRPELRFDRERTEQAALRRLRAYTHYQPIAADLIAGGAKYALLRRSVDDRVRQNLEAALRLLGIVHDMRAMDNALRGLLGGNKGDAVELIDVTLQKSEIREEVLKHLEHVSPSASPGHAIARALALVEGKDIQLAMIAQLTLERAGEQTPIVQEPTYGEPLMPKTIVERLFVLEGVQLFHGLSVDDLAAVAAIVTEGHAEGGEVIYAQGDPGDSMYIIASGEVRLLKDGKPLMDLSAGDSFGQVSILDQGSRPVTAQASFEGVDYLYLKRAPFMDLIADRPEVVGGLFVVLARRLRELVNLTGTQASGGRASSTISKAPRTP